FAAYLDGEIKDSKEVLDQDPSEAAAYLRLAKAQQMTADESQAMETLLDGIAENPGSVELWMMIGSIEAEAKRDKEAISIYSEVIRLDEANGQAQNNIALLLAKSRMTQDLRLAARHALNAVLLQPENPEFLDTLASVRFELGQDREAVALIEKAIRL